MLFNSSTFKPVSVLPVGRGVPVDKSIIYLPTVEDLKLICLQYFTQRKNFFDDAPQFYLAEPKVKVEDSDRNLHFNVEFANVTGIEINLSKAQRNKLLLLRSGAA